MPHTSALLHFEEDAHTAAKLAANGAGVPMVMARHRFPDGELKLRLLTHLPARVVLLRSLHQPNDKLIELLLAARTARTLGARHLTLVAPYLAYMRQDMAFTPGEAISQTIIGHFLAELFDAVITVDPHLHRISTLDQAIPTARALALSAAPLLGDLIAAHHAHPLLIGPDNESAQWVAQAAARHSFETGVCHKTRLGDRQVQVTLPNLPVTGRSVVLLDDVASSGHTLATAARQLLGAGAASVDVAVTHALFAEGALPLIHDAGVRQVWSTDCIKHSSNAISVAPMIGAALFNLATEDIAIGKLARP